MPDIITRFINYIREKQINDITQVLDKDVMYHHCMDDGKFYKDKEYKIVVADFSLFMDKNKILPLSIQRDYLFTTGLCQECYEKRISNL